MEEKKESYVIGPHHGEYPMNPRYAKVEEFDFYEPDSNDPKPFSEFKEFIKGCKHEIDLEEIEEELWGTFTKITPKIDNDSDKKFSEHMNKWYKDQILGQLLGESMTHFLTASGDNDAFDYVPGFIHSVFDLCRLMGQPELVDKFYKAAYILDPTFPEFFPDEYENQ